jgi:D-alanyl-D-alanine carboxypeptidase/D-alanyl-D-alanine-endopeptidase (penicillin-binding protein 4)
VNNVRTVAGSNASVVVRRLADGRVEARGSIGSRSGTRSYLLVVDDPAIYAAGALHTALTARGITVTGTVRLGATPPHAEQVASLPSPPLWQLASVMNRESINHFAELLFRDVAHASTPDRIGSAEAGNLLLQQFMARKVGARAGAIYAADGSGLSTLDRATPRALVQLLAYAHRAPWGAHFHATLPVAGESETLRHRMRTGPANGNLHAKTGTTNEVISLGGYVTAENGEVLAFAFMYNGSDRWNAREAIDASGVTLANFAR